MSQVFHKSCYTSRCPGYKYRTLSTNTGEKSKRRDSNEDSTLDRKFREIRKEMTKRIFTQMDQAQIARERVITKFDKIDAKISYLLELKQNVVNLREDLRTAENTLAVMIEKIEKLDAVLPSETISIISTQDSLRQNVVTVKE